MQASESPEGQYKDGVRCYMTKEGALVCERLPAGNYRYFYTCLLVLYTISPADVLGVHMHGSELLLHTG